MDLAKDAPIVLDVGEGERAGATVIKAARPELSLIEFVVKSGDGVQPHYHKGRGVRALYAVGRFARRIVRSS